MLPVKPKVLRHILCVIDARPVPCRVSYRLELEWGATPALATVTLLAPGSTTAIERVVMTRDGRKASLAFFNGPNLAPAEPPSLAGRVGAPI